jgi:hypothetical protein
METARASFDASIDLEARADAATAVVCHCAAVALGECSAFEVQKYTSVLLESSGRK